MDKRFPYDSPRDQPRRPPQVGNMSALELEEALFFQRRQEIQRDLQLRQMLLQEQFDQQQNLHQQRMLELQQHIAGQQAMANLQHEEQQILQDMRRRQLQQQLQQEQQRQLGLPTTVLGSPIRSSMPINPQVVVENSLAANAQRRPSGNRKRSFDHSAEEVAEKPPAKRPARKASAPKSASKRDKARSGSIDQKPKAKGKTASATKKKGPPGKKSPSPEKASALLHHDEQTREAVEALLSAESNHGRRSVEPEESPVIQKGTIESIVEAAKSDEKVDNAATLMFGLRKIEWPETEPELESSGGEDDGNRIKIDLPGFHSKLPRLPIEPVFEVKPKEKKEGKEDEKKEEDKDTSQKNSSTTEPTANGSSKKEGKGIKKTDYPYPVDTWWPSVSTVRKERKMNGERSDEEDFIEEPGLFSADAPYRANVRAIRSRLSNQVEPGVLEKVPHCRIHRLKTRALRGATIPDHAFCWQVTDTYCTDVMVCCSMCSTWRHAGCGGHYKPFAVRDIIASGEPFTAICDLCYQEQSILQDYPRGTARLERQRAEQLRRGLSTSAVIRQSSFVKHGGTYKWPLGSVSTTHIGGHTRSVLSRYDKAEKQWTEMTNRLGRGYGYRPKERIKVRTRELERLLVAIEDSEGITDRHNMMQFLVHDSRKEYPALFEKHLKNLFDPEDDDDHFNHDSETSEFASAPTPLPLEEEEEDDEEEAEPHKGLVGRRPPSQVFSEKSDEDSQPENTCARQGCSKKPRFDSLFCSDSCGVSALEWDLYRVMEIAGEMHPSLMRA